MNGFSIIVQDRSYIILALICKIMYGGVADHQSDLVLSVSNMTEKLYRETFRIGRT